ncbi:MAG TPA: hypothetical protein VF707_14920 [Ardenticatenaceae bacterium]|jgi:hypothetical protein
MSPTLLEGVMVILLIIIAWQLGLLLAPTVRHIWHQQMQALDDASDNGLADAERIEDKQELEESDHGRE